jgi:hypothetical protein
MTTPIYNGCRLRAVPHQCEQPQVARTWYALPFSPPCRAHPDECVPEQHLGDPLPAGHLRSPGGGIPNPLQGLLRVQAQPRLQARQPVRAQQPLVERVAAVELGKQETGEGQDIGDFVSDQVSKWWRPQSADIPDVMEVGGRTSKWAALPLEGALDLGERSRMKSGGCGAGDPVCAKGGEVTSTSSSCDGCPIRMITTVPAFLFSATFCSSPQIQHGVASLEPYAIVHQVQEKVPEDEELQIRETSIQTFHCDMQGFEGPPSWSLHSQSIGANFTHRVQ